MDEQTGDPSGETERPREIYLASCSSIAESLNDLGFKYAASRQHSRRRAGDFVFQVSFQSSHYNAAGQQVRMSIFGTIFSPKLKAWRKSHSSIHDNDCVAGGQIGNLQPLARWLEWNLADPSRRDEVISEAIEAVRELALPYFARFENADELIPYLIDHDLPSMDLSRVIDFLLCFADEDSARRASVRFLERRPDLQADYQSERLRLAKEGPHRRPSGYAQTLAYASLFLGLGELS